MLTINQYRSIGNKEIFHIIPVKIPVNYKILIGEALLQSLYWVFRRQTLSLNYNWAKTKGFTYCKTKIEFFLMKNDKTLIFYFN